MFMESSFSNYENAQSQLGNQSNNYIKLLPRDKTREYFLMDDKYEEIPYDDSEEQVQAKSLTFSLESLEQIGNIYIDFITNKQIIQKNYLDNGIEKESIYSQYLDRLGGEELENLQELLQQATQLLHLYEQQYENYLSKYTEYNSIYEEYNAIYNQFQGTEEMKYYLSNGNITIEDYRQKVKEAWWAFLNILDYTYTKERERGLYA